MNRYSFFTMCTMDVLLQCYESEVFLYSAKLAIKYGRETESLTRLELATVDFSG